MRIVFLAVNDEFAGKMQKHLYNLHPEWVAGSVISTCFIYKKNKLGTVMFLIKKSCIFYAFQLLKIKIFRNLFRFNKKETPKSLAKKHNIDIFYCKNINDKKSLQRLREWKPDIVISTNFNQYVGSLTRNVALIGTWNLHKSYLPYYRGMAPSFYALLEGAENVGSTLHVMDKGFDTGPIITQVKVRVQKDDTVYTLNQRTSEVGGKMLANFLDNISPESIRSNPQPPGNWRNYSYPSRQDIREFRKKGLRFDKGLIEAIWS